MPTPKKNSKAASAKDSKKEIKKAPVTKKEEAKPTKKAATPAKAAPAPAPKKAAPVAAKKVIKAEPPAKPAKSVKAEEVAPKAEKKAAAPAAAPLKGAKKAAEAAAKPVVKMAKSAPLPASTDMNKLEIFSQIQKELRSQFTSPSTRPAVFDDPAAKLDLPDLLETQKTSYEWFIKEGLGDELESFSPIYDYSGKIQIDFLRDVVLEEPKYNVHGCKTKDMTYAYTVKIPVRITNKETGEMQESLVFVGELPKMTQQGTFVINGAERVTVSQIVRSPGIYFTKETKPNGQKLFSATIIPDKGGWLYFDIDQSGVIYVRIDKTRKLYITTLLRVLGFQVKEMEHLFSHKDFIKKTLERDDVKTKEEALIEVYKKLRPGEPPSPEGGEKLLYARFFDPRKYDLGKVGRYKINKKLNLNSTSKVLTNEDIITAVDYLIGLTYEIGDTDDIDHLGNRRIRSVGELLKTQFRVGLTRIEKIVREKAAIATDGTISVKNTINFKPLVAAIKEFFGSSQLSQFMDQTNPLAELNHKRRISALGPGGLTRERAGFAVRDIHPSHYGRICPIETPEGPNAGLINTMATYSRINGFGFMETPYFKVVNGKVTNELIYLTADDEENYKAVSGDLPLKPDGTFRDELVPVRYRNEYILANKADVDLMSVSPIQFASVGAALIPFLEHDDANRALMGSNMQRQAVPLIASDRPYVGTGLEQRVAIDSGVMIQAEFDGEVTFVDANSITIKGKDKTQTYQLIKYVRSNNDTCINQKPLVKVGQKIKKGEIISDGVSTKQGELALGRNIIAAFMPWEGYNFEDAILISRRLVEEDVFTSIHITKHEIECRKTKLGDEEITNEIPNVAADKLKYLDENGIIQIGADVEAGDILVGKVTPKGDHEHPPEERLLRAIFGDKAKDMRDTSLRVPHGERGRVIDVKVFDRAKGDELSPGVNKIVRVYLAQKRKIGVGDKMAGRHGNKGIIAKILAPEDMPFTADGTPVDIVLNPLGVPSRMNVGQIYECLLGYASMILGEKIAVPSFDERFGEQASFHLVSDKLNQAKKVKGYDWVSPDGKVTLYDGRTGTPFDRAVTVGNLYMLKLVHLVDDKIHARSIGPYSLVTQQPLGGKSKFGGQRLGEMEVWAIEAYGAAYILQELLTTKSDDITGRSKAYESIIKGRNIKKPGIPESFKVLMRELQSLGLDIKAMRDPELHEDVTEESPFEIKILDNK